MAPVVYWVAYAATQTVIGAFLVKVAIAYVISRAATKIFAPETPKGVTQNRTQTIREPTAARRILYGQAQIGGAIVYMEVTDNNKYLHMVIAFASHEVESFDTFYFDEVELTLTGNEVTGPSRFNGKAEIYPMLGTDSQAAQPELTSRVVNWTANHRLRGIAYAYVRLKWAPNKFTSGIPNVTALISGKKVYDPRTGLTAYSNNAALCAADYLMDTRLGLGIPLSSIDETVLTTAANTADENVTLLAGGTEKRYTCNGVIDMESSPREIISAMNTAKGGATVYNMGKWYIHVGSYKTPTVHLTDGDMAGPIRVSTRQPRSSLFNSVKGVYASPDNDWQLSDFPVVTSTTYLAEDNDETIWRELELPYTITASMAQRLGLLELNKARRQISCKIPFKLTAMDVIPADVIQLTSDRMGWAAKTFEVTEWAFSSADDNALTIELSLTETDSAVYSWSTADESAANAAPTTNLPDFSVVAAPTNLSVSSFQVPTGTGSDETYKVLLNWTQPADEFVTNGGFIEIQYKQSADTDWSPSWQVDGSLTTSEIPMLERDTSYDVRIRSNNGLAKSDYIQISGFVVLGSGGVGTTQDWGDWVSTPGACGATPSCDWGDWVSTPGTPDDWGSWT